jgi:hypothetical protein
MNDTSADTPSHGAVGFRADQQQAYAGARTGWSRFFAALETLLAGQDTP